MKLYNLLVSSILTLLLICFLVLPQKVFAIDFNFFNFDSEDDYQILSEFESRKILQNLPDILYSKWTKLKVSGYSSLEEETAICLLKYISTLDMFNYFFRDLPIDVSFNVTKEALDMARLIGTEDTSGMIGKLEKGTVNAAVNYLKDYFSKGNIKVSFGAMEMKYKTESGDVDSPLQYIIMYKRIDDKRSKVVARIYSPKEIVPPASRGSIGLVSGFSSSLNYNKKLSPFIIEISGIMDDGLYGSYFWDEKSTVIKTVFPGTVPDFGLKPKTWQEKYIIEPIKNVIDSFSGIISFFTGSSTNELTEYIFKDTADKEAINEEVEKLSEGNDLEEDYPEKATEDSVIKVVEVVKNQEDKEIAEDKEIDKIEENKEVEASIVCSKSSQYVSSRDIIINEVAWMGSKASSNDEWIELRNVSGADVNLKGWTLRDGGDQINIIFENITIREGGFLLLERTDDNSVPDKTADLIYTGALSNSKEELYLFDNLCQLRDFVSGNPEWPAGDNESRKTMERNDDLSGWHTYSGSGINNIFGTPSQSNSGLKQEAATAAVVSTNSSSSSAISGGGVVVPIVSYCPQSDLSVPAATGVIINEVAWMGSENSPNDEWIELKNVSSETISLENWQLLDASENIKIIFGSSEIIDPQGFYLLERTNDDSVSNIQTDNSYSGEIYTGSLSNNNESLRLFNADCQLMDEASANPEWPAGDNESRKTMERNDDLSGWHTYSSDSADSLSGLWGTPKAENSPKSIIEDDDSEGDEETEIDNSSHLLITEVQTGGAEGIEYVEIYNQTDVAISLCPSEASCFYLSYYPSTHTWYDPYHNWKFPEGAIIAPNSYYLIDIFGSSEICSPEEECNLNKWKINATTDQLNNSIGSLSLFSSNPKYIEPELEDNEEFIKPSEEDKIAATVALKVDTASWKGGDEELFVKEGEPFIGIKQGKVMARKWSNGKYRDTDNNFNDFQLEDQSLRGHAPRPPEKVQNLTVSINEEQKNSAILSWTSSVDEDTLPENLDYEIYYSRNGSIDDENLVNINDYVKVDILSGENNTRRAVIADLFYDSEYRFKVIARDQEKNISPLSDEVSFAITAANHQKRAPFSDFRKSNHSQFNGPSGLSLSRAVLAEGNQQFTFNNDFTSNQVIDENGTVYFSGADNRSWRLYAYSGLQKKWSFDCPQACGINPSLGNDGAIYLLSGRFVYAISPSGKEMWKKEYARMISNSIIIGSDETIYFLASKSETGASLFSINNGIETEVYNAQDLSPSYFSELVMDDSDIMYFSVNDYIIKCANGVITKYQIFPQYGEAYGTENRNKIAVITYVYISFDGKLLFIVNNGKYATENEQHPVLYAMENDFSKILWSKEDYHLVLGFNESEFYYLRLEYGTYPMIYDFGAADFEGNTVWEMRGLVSGPIISDASSRIYFTTPGAIFGYSSADKPNDMLEDKIFYITAGNYFGPSFSIGKDNIFFSDTQRVYSINTPQ